MPASDLRTVLLYHFCRLRLPQVPLPVEVFERQLRRAFDMFRAKRDGKGPPVAWDHFLEDLHTLDWFIAVACLEGQSKAWEALFAARANRTDSLLVDALRLRAVRLFPRDPERQDEAVAEFWGYLLAGEREGSLPILARYDGQRPLVPWLIRVFQNKHLSDLRHGAVLHPLPEAELGECELHLPADADARWQRWLFSGFHRLDFTAGLRPRPLWDIVMIVLLIGGIGLTATGVYLAIRRIRVDVAGLARFGGTARARFAAPVPAATPPES